MSTALDCAHCEKPLTPSDIVWVDTLTDTQPDAICGLCAIQLVASPHALVTLLIEPADPAMAVA